MADQLNLGLLVLRLVFGLFLAYHGYNKFFGGGRRDPNAPQRGDDLRYDLKITFEEAIGKAKEPRELAQMLWRKL